MDRIRPTDFDISFGSCDDITQIRNFVLDNARAISDIVSAVKGETGISDTMLLVEALMVANPDRQLVYDILLDWRETLVTSSSTITVIGAAPWPELDAAVRWLGGRLDDLLFSIR